MACDQLYEELSPRQKIVLRRLSQNDALYGTDICSAQALLRRGLAIHSSARRAGYELSPLGIHVYQSQKEKT